MAHTRRALIAGLAVLPAFATTTVASVDPIFAAIERHRAAMRALEDIDKLAEPDAYAEAEQEIAAAYDAMLATVPQTVPGCMALLDHMIDDVGVDVEEAVSVLREALDGIAARAV
jgi:hypothetical protein